jgi:hypothetical protein
MARGTGKKLFILFSLTYLFLSTTHALVHTHDDHGPHKNCQIENYLANINFETPCPIIAAAVLYPADEPSLLESSCLLVQMQFIASIYPNAPPA